MAEDFYDKKKAWIHFYEDKLNSFEDYLYWIKKKINEKEFDEAWYIANQGVIHLPSDCNYMMYYQMSIICNKEKKYQKALITFGYMIHYLGRLGGRTHEYYFDQLLQKNNLCKDKKKILSMFVSDDPKKINKYFYSTSNNIQEGKK